MVVRHGEHLHVATQTIPLETVRIEKHIVTEQRTFTADIRREELRITRTPLPSSENTPTHNDDHPPRPLVIVLHEEQITLSKTVVPVEKVTIEVTTVTGEHVVDDLLRQEEIDIVEHTLPTLEPLPMQEPPPSMQMPEPEDRPGT